MNTTININGKEVEITLTKEQIQKIKKTSLSFKDITSHEIACSVLGKDPSESKSVHDQLDDIAKAINEVDGHFKPDYNDPEQKKWYPFFDASKGFGFSRSDYDLWATRADAGSRLCLRFRSEKISDFFGKQFEQLHKKSFYA